jgi:hypothetical protein
MEWKLDEVKAEYDSSRKMGLQLDDYWLDRKKKFLLNRGNVKKLKTEDLRVKKKAIALRTVIVEQMKSKIILEQLKEKCVLLENTKKEFWDESDENEKEKILEVMGELDSEYQRKRNWVRRDMTEEEGLEWERNCEQTRYDSNGEIHILSEEEKLVRWIWVAERSKEMFKKRLEEENDGWKWEEKVKVLTVREKIQKREWLQQRTMMNQKRENESRSVDPLDGQTIELVWGRTLID